jgi:hypothetical protein
LDVKRDAGDRLERIIRAVNAHPALIRDKSKPRRMHSFPSRRRIDSGKPQDHLLAMVSEEQQTHPGVKVPVFVIACWALGLMAFMQLWVAGMALAARLEDSRQVRVVEKEVLKPVIVRVPA